MSVAQDVMEIRARLFAVVLGFAVLLFVINLVRTKKLKEEFALLWLLTGIVLVLTPLFIDYLDMLAYALGIEYPPALIFVLAIISLLLVLFQFSMRISRFSEQIKVLIQELALLRVRLEDLERIAPRLRDAQSRHLPDVGETMPRQTEGETMPRSQGGETAESREEDHAT